MEWTRIRSEILDSSDFSLDRKLTLCKFIDRLIRANVSTPAEFGAKLEKIIHCYKNEYANMPQMISDICGIFCQVDTDLKSKSETESESECPKKPSECPKSECPCTNSDDTAAEWNYIFTQMIDEIMYIDDVDDNDNDDEDSDSDTESESESEYELSDGPLIDEFRSQIRGIRGMIFTSLAFTVFSTSIFLASLFNKHRD